MMKKIIKICFFFLMIFLYSIPVFASVNTYERNLENNYLVHGSDVVVNDSNLSAILSTPAVDASEKVYDFAGLYSDSEVEELYLAASKYIETYNLDLVLVTTQDNTKESTRVYAEDFYDYNDFGIGTNYDGVLFVIDMQNREFYMLVSGSAINMYPDSRIDECLEVVFSDIAAGDYYEGTKKFIDKISTYANIGAPDEYGNEPEPKGLAKLSIMPWSSIIISSAIATVVVMWIFIRKNKLVRVATSSSHYLKSSDIHLINELFLGRNISRSARSHDTSSGGGHSGGSSVSHGSSGRSHSGGGRNF